MVNEASLEGRAFATYRKMAGNWWAQCVMDFGQVAVARGLLGDYASVNKFGRNPNIDTTTDPEDVWDAGGIWAAPTQARTHDVASTDTNDTSAGTGARTVRIFGLTTWDTNESSEDVTLNGTSNVATSSSYVIIHRMQILTAGSGGTNAGNITATAQTDATVTAQITAGFGQTLMTIYGIPSTKKFYIQKWYGSWAGAVGSGTDSAIMRVNVKANADQSDSLFIVKHVLAATGGGNSYINHDFVLPLEVAGPAIVKITVQEVTANNTDIAAGFDGYLIAN